MLFCTFCKGVSAGASALLLGLAAFRHEVDVQMVVGHLHAVLVEGIAQRLVERVVGVPVILYGVQQRTAYSMELAP